MSGYANEEGYREEVSRDDAANSPPRSQSPSKKAALAAKALLMDAFSLMGRTQSEKEDLQSLPELEPGELDEEVISVKEEAGFGWELLRNALSSGAPAQTQPYPANREQTNGPRRESVILMDAMEGGMAREVTEEFMQPLPKAKRLWRFHVVRSKDEYKLFADHDGCFLMQARVRKEDRRIEFFLYNPSDAGDLSPKKSRPAFTMAFNESSTEWRLVQEKCERCLYAPPHLSCSSQGKQQVAHIRQSKENVDDGVWNCMDINIPGLFTDNRRVIWCPRLGFGDLGAEPGPDHTSHTLITMKPQWNEEVESLVLDFMDRDIIASAKNFQLALRQKPRYVVCQYGKIGASTFALDCRYPISLIQAFACAMATISWT